MKQRKIHNNKALLGRRRELRKNSTPAERILWLHLKDCKMEKVKFRRQHSIGSYVVDFYCPSCRLVIELDGSSHDGATQQEYDAIRSSEIEVDNVKILRFSNEAVLKHTEDVLLEIRKYVQGKMPNGSPPRF
ncbi:MAG TPA: endonuclease domain-containing protein [Bacteroidota bacterium]|nr:endonuclease domain-containing protein [Bacteroidota bacterium]